MEVNFFISQDGTVPKRKHTRAACDGCRRRKKRCHHENTKQTPDSLTSPTDGNSPNANYSVRPSFKVPAPAQTPDPGNSRQHRPQSDQRAPQLRIGKRRNVSENRPRGSHASRFIGDLNPVIFFVDDTGTRLFRGRADQRDCGIWLDGDNDVLVSGEEDASSSNSANPSSRQRGVFRQGRPLLPLRQTQEKLVDIYLRRVHPILPLIDEDDFQARFNEGSVSPYLLQAICLVASKDYEAEPFLRLPNQTDTLTPSEFSHLLYKDLSHTIAMKLERNRVTLIQLHILLSLHVSGPGSFEEGNLHLAQAFHHICTVGLHLTKSGPTQHNKHSIRLFWCLWSLDRWNAAMHGRPLVIHDRDVGQQLVDVISLFEGPSRVFLLLASTLSEVFVVYRPVLEAPVDENKPEIPRFEDILAQCPGGWDASPDQIFFLELAYHAIALLASRPWGLKAQPRSHTLYLRQDLSVYRLATLTQMCDAKQIVPLPMVPYAFSLGFSISYKQIKRCQLPSTQHAAKQHLQAFYKSLEGLSPTWWAAQVMTRVGRCAFSGIQRMGERANEQGVVNPPTRNKCMDIVASTSRTSTEAIGLATGLHSIMRESEEIEGGRSRQLPANGMNKNYPVSFDLTDMGNDILNNPAAEPGFDDIDNLLADFLNINIPTYPTQLSLNDPDMVWNPEGLPSL